MTAPTQRVEALEAEAFRTSRQLVDVTGRLHDLKGRVDHVTNAIGDLSEGQRELRFDLGEFRREVQERFSALEHSVEERTSTIAQEQTRQGVLLAAIAQKLGVGDQGDGQQTS